jgi:hypothetical protein
MEHYSSGKSNGDYLGANDNLYRGKDMRMSREAIRSEVQDCAELSQNNLEWYVQTGELKYLERFIFWSKQMMYWTTWFGTEE